MSPALGTLGLALALALAAAAASASASASAASLSAPGDIVVAVGPLPEHRVVLAGGVAELEALEADASGAAVAALRRRVMMAGNDGGAAAASPLLRGAKGFFRVEESADLGVGAIGGLVKATRAAKNAGAAAAAAAATADLFPIPSKLSQQAVFGGLAPLLETGTIESTIRNLSTAYLTRYYKSKSGEAAAMAMYANVSKLAEDAGNGLVETELVHSSQWLQPSVVARFKGSSSDAAGRLVVGTHIDSVSKYGVTQPAPGADDDGSGSSCLFALYSALVKGQWQPRHTVEFHWYSAEEGGLRGSQQLASTYAELAINVQAMLNMDMTGYGTNADPIGIIEDYTNPDLSAFLVKLVNGYSDLSYVPTKCGYACSDHASWDKAGYRACMPAERAFRDSNPYIHSDRDVLANLNMHRATQIARVALGFLVELDAQ